MGKENSLAIEIEENHYGQLKVIAQKQGSKLEDESDQYHEAVLQFREQVLQKGRYELIATSYILDETPTLIRFRIGIEASIDFSKKIRKSEVVKIVQVSREIEEKALDIFERYDDKDFSFTDCKNMEAHHQTEDDF